MNFDELGLSKEILSTINEIGYKEPTEIQKKAIPQILMGRDVLGCAQTGTGKTGSFVMPLVEILSSGKSKSRMPRSLILAPTRELAMQVSEEFNVINKYFKLQMALLIGGVSFTEQDIKLAKGVDVLVATPGRLLDHIERGKVIIKEVKLLIIDEADRMLDIGFHDDILRIFSYMPKQRQTLMFSATMPSKIRDLASKILKSPEEITIAISKPAEGVLQAVYLCYDMKKAEFIKWLINDKPSCKSIIIFSSTKREVSDTVRTLRNKEYQVEGISSDLVQSEREAVLNRFRSKETRVLVATDVMSRGIDIKDINLVINYNVPSDAEDYVHRVGRTARAETTGIAVTLVNPDDMYKFLRIERLIEREILKVPIPEHIGESPKWSPNATDKRNSSKGGKGKKFFKKRN